MASKLLYFLIVVFFGPVFFAWFILNVYPWFTNPSLPLLIDGFVAKGFENIHEVFRKVIEEGCIGGGAGFSVYHEGNLLVDLWGGYSDSMLLRPWKKDTLTLTFSMTKGISALCAAILVDRGILDYDSLVTKYWPEFGQNGKENITVKILLSHQAGLIGLERPLELSDFHNPSIVKQKLEENKPSWPPGEAFGYHAYTFGFYVSQLIQSVDPKKRSLAQFFEEEIAKPLGIDFHIGLPKSEYHRMARLWEPGDNIKKIVERVINLENLEIFRCAIHPSSLIKKTVSSVNIKLHSMGSPEWLEVELPSANGVGTARSVAKLYGHIVSGGQVQGQTLLSKNTISKLLIPLNSGREKVFCINMVGGYGLWHMKDPYQHKNLIFGHPGYGGQISGGDLESQIGFAFVSNVMSSDMTNQDPRFISLLTALYESLEKLKKLKK